VGIGFDWNLVIKTTEGDFNQVSGCGRAEKHQARTTVVAECAYRSIGGGVLFKHGLAGEPAEAVASGFGQSGERGAVEFTAHRAMTVSGLRNKFVDLEGD
jgi:hypothetical protein